MDIIFETESLELFERVSQDIVNNLYNTRSTSTTYVEPHIIDAAKLDVRNVFSTNNFDMHKVTELICSKGWNEEKVKSFITLLKNKKTELLYAALNHHNSTFGENITDYDWLLKLVFGTSELKTLQFPLLQLKLHSVNSNGEKKGVIYELNKDVLQKMIIALEEIT